jgi:hypothetical protein
LRSFNRTAHDLADTRMVLLPKHWEWHSHKVPQAQEGIDPATTPLLDKFLALSRNL